ncbi:MAG: RtcB family protein [Bacteroidetes bacterium]|nr:MAG: RtcB family protein [Bacteroidota bacterium]
MKRSEKITTSDFHKWGIEDLNLIKTIGKITKGLINTKTFTKPDLLAKIEAIRENPEAFLEDAIFAPVAQIYQAMPEDQRKPAQKEGEYELKPDLPTYTIFGREGIDDSAVNQMNIAMRLPVSVAGALMPDAHHGYGLPIGGVLATEVDKIIPFAVGVDIACRMCLSVFDIEASYLQKNSNKLKNMLLKNTCFGTGNGFEKTLEDSIWEKDEWRATKVIKDLREKATKQIGSSGTGNHFVEWGVVEITQEPNEFGLPAGKYVALLSHSGSRGFGAGIAEYYSKLAMQKTKLPQDAKHLAWLDLNTQEGQEYWIGMNLAGEYASANHHHIHRRMATDLALQPVKMIENHHNFAWKETLTDGTEVMVHRKGATPANTQEIGIIPGSMTKPGFVVRGKGFPASLASASHGAGRMMSRTKAKQAFTKEQWERVLVEEGVTLIGADLDEAPMAYKDIRQVMAFQQDLVEVLATFYPKIVRMAEPERGKPWDKKKNKNKGGDLEFGES